MFHEEVHVTWIVPLLAGRLIVRQQLIVIGIVVESGTRHVTPDVWVAIRVRRRIRLVGEILPIDGRIPESHGSTNDKGRNRPRHRLTVDRCDVAAGSRLVGDVVGAAGVPDENRVTPKDRERRSATSRERGRKDHGHRRDFAQSTATGSEYGGLVVDWIGAGWRSQ